MPLPFEQIFADYFDYGGRHFLVIGDRFSGWADVFATVPGLNISGAAALVCLFCTYFATFAVFPMKFRQMAGPNLKQLSPLNF